MIDLDAARSKREAARREADGKGPIVKFGGGEYELAPELPYSVLEALRGLTVEETAAASLANMTEGMLGEHYAAFVATSPSMEDVNELVGGVMEEYGLASPLASSVS